MAIKFGLRAKVAELRGEYLYLDDQIATGVKVRLSNPVPVAQFIDLYDRMIGTINYLASIPKTAATRDIFSAEFEVPANTVVALFTDIETRVAAIKDWLVANQQTAKESYTLDGTGMSSQGTYSVAEMSGLVPLLDNLATALNSIRE